MHSTNAHEIQIQNTHIHKDSHSFLDQYIRLQPQRWTIWNINRLINHTITENGRVTQCLCVCVYDRVCVFRSLAIDYQNQQCICICLPVRCLFAHFKRLWKGVCTDCLSKLVCLQASGTTFCSCVCITSENRRLLIYINFRHKDYN